MKNTKNRKCIFTKCLCAFFFLLILGIYPGSLKGDNTEVLSVLQQKGKRITGVVKDAADKSPLPGVTISIEKSTRGVITDVDGTFSLEDVPEDGNLVISYVGYESITIPVAEKSFFDIELFQKSSDLEEVTIVGYGTQKKVNLTGAVAQIDDRVLKDRPVTNVGQALQGVIANFNITPTSGEPGAGVNYNVRGATTLSGRTYNTSPYFLVDGVPVDNIDNINPSDIQNVSILKDAASAAIYGAKAAYGVVLITTKQGGKNQKSTITYSNMFGFKSATRIPNQVNSLDFARAYNIASANSGQSPYFTDEHIARIEAYMKDPQNTPSNIPDPNNPDRWAYASLENDNVDWFREYFKNSTFSQKHDVSITGGNNLVNHYTSFGYYRENGLLRYGNEKFERYNVTSNVHFEPLKWLRGDVRVRFSRDKKDIPATAYNNDIGNWVHLASTRFPNWALKDPNGHWSLASEMVRQWEGRSPSSGNMLSITGALEMEFIKDWKINMDYTYRNTSLRSQNQYVPYVMEYTISEKPIMKTENYYAEDQSQTDYTSANFYTSYQKNIGLHFFSALVGQQFELNRYNYLYGMRRNLIATDLPSFGVATGEQTTSGSQTHWANTGTFFRANYNYAEKYLLEFNARYDGSSRFQKGKRFGFFPSISVGYNVAREDFWPLKDRISMLKLRASYGSLGNQEVSNYLYLSTMGIESNYPYMINSQLVNILHAPGIVSADLTWETATTFNVGLDAAAFDNRLLFSFDAYRRNTSDMFGPADVLPATLGVNPPQRNNAELQTTGFELNIGWRDKVGEVDYNVNLILANSTSKLTKFNNPTKILSGYYEGQTLGEIWGYTTKGLLQTEEQVNNMPDQSLFYDRWTVGDVEYVDLNGDGAVNNGKNTYDDHGDLKVIGNSDPKYTFGVNLGASWKGFDLSMFFQGVGKRDFAPPVWGNGGVFFWGFTGGYGANLYEESMDFWTPDNAGAYLPKPYHTGEVAKNHEVQTRYLQNAAYIRLKNLQIGYTIPQSVTNRIKLQNIRLFISGENLFTITSLQKNFDPELTGGSWGAGKIYPLMKTLSFGLNVNF